MTRVVAVHQPNFLPWLGFFDKLARADVLVLLDDVQFPRTGAGTWLNRVRVLVDGRPAWLTVPVLRAGRGLQSVREVEVDDAQPWRRRVLRTLETSYRRARGFDEVFPLVREIVEHPASRLAELNEHGIVLLADALGLDTSRLAHGSALGVGDARGTDLLIALTRAAGGSTYLSGDGAEGYQEPEKYAAAGLELRFQEFRHPTYPQPLPEPVHGLSVVDALMSCGVEGTRDLVQQRG
jgi:hypothetical protein